MAKGFLARLVALRALAVFTGTALLLVLLAGSGRADEVYGAGVTGGGVTGGGVDGGGEVAPAGVVRSGNLTLHQETISRQIDGWLNVIVDGEGRVARMLSDGLAWRLEISSLQRPDSQGYIFSIRPAGQALIEQPCGPGELCPAGYSVAGTSRLVALEPLREMRGAAGQTVYRQAVKLVLPFDLSWVGFYDDFQIAVAKACRDAFVAARGHGRSRAELAVGHLEPQLTFPLKAAVFSDGRVAEAELAVHLRCWGGTPAD